MIRALVAQTLSNRPVIYKAPGLEDVTENRSSRINSKLIGVLVKFAKAYPGGENIVEGEMEKRKTAGPSPRKRKNGDEGGDGAGATVKVVKRKKKEVVKAEIESEKESEKSA